MVMITNEGNSIKTGLSSKGPETADHLIRENKMRELYKEISNCSDEKLELIKMILEAKAISKAVRKGCPYEHKFLKMEFWMEK